MDNGIKEYLEDTQSIVVESVKYATEVALAGQIPEAQGLMLSAIVAQNDAIIHLLAKIAGVEIGLTGL